MTFKSRGLVRRTSKGTPRGLGRVAATGRTPSECHDAQSRTLISGPNDCNIKVSTEIRLLNTEEKKRRKKLEINIPAVDILLINIKVNKTILIYWLRIMIRVQCEHQILVDRFE